MQDTAQFEKRYQMLNTEQRQAVDTLEGPVLVLAGPGSGKTELLSIRVANILRTTDTHASSILCLTFTESAATNMRNRLAGLIGSEAYKVAIHTFHSFGTEIINQNPEFFYQGALYNPADDLTRIQILEEILESLPYDNPLKSYHPDQGYTYLYEIISKIGQLKKGGVLPNELETILKQNADFLEKANPLIAAFFADRITKKVIVEIRELIKTLQELVLEQSDHYFKPLAETCIEQLVIAHKKAEDQSSTKPISAWKKDHIKKNKKNEPVLKEFLQKDKMIALAQVYDLYQKKLHEKGFFDFEDMLLDTVNALETYPELKLNIQEKYLYTLVDEFQDTSGVQMRLLDNILNTEINEGRPNILAVGDDDQSIFKFQGANISNIMGFHQKYRDPEMVVLSQNYRSTQAILDYVRNIIVQGEERLENLFQNQFEKKLIAGNVERMGGEITEKEFPTDFHEMVWIAEDIKKNIEKKDLNEIAIIAPKHRILEQMAKILDYHDIPVAYERKKDLLSQKNIQEIVTILEFLYMVNRGANKEADALLPQILSFAFWQIPRIEIWKISLTANKKRRGWLEIMQEHESQKIKDISRFFIELAMAAKEHTAEELIDFITGSRSIKYKDESENQLLLPELETQYASPYKNFYFNEEKFQEHRQEYIEFLLSLQSFIDSIRAYKGSEILSLSDLIEFVYLHKKHKLPLTFSSQFNDDQAAVNVLTAHKSKGLEYETVYVIHCQDDIWVKRGLRDKLTFPSNIPLGPQAENQDDALRLFYVALTRAKKNIYLTHHAHNTNGKGQSKIRFLNEPSLQDTYHESQSIEAEKLEFAQGKNLINLLNVKQEIVGHTLRSADEKALMTHVVENYKLSVTHLNNFLNVVDGGPQKFLEQNLLRFPQMPNKAASYGSAIHGALHQFQNEFKKNQKVPSIDFLNDRFHQSLSKQRLNEKDFNECLEKGVTHLSHYYDQRKGSFKKEDIPEFRFDTQWVKIGDAFITGTIDKMEKDEENKEITVYDYKTGKALYNWQGKYEMEKLKAWKYKNQLIFYKVLVENARDFKNRYTVNHGILEFVEPADGEIRLLDLQIERDDAKRMEQLIEAVYHKIIHLDFPDISHYEKNMRGVENFIEELIEGTI